MKLSVVIPVYSAEISVNKLVKELFINLNKEQIEIIMINDASHDRSEIICEKIAVENKNITFLSLRKNFEEHNAVMCGLNYAQGEYSVIIDDDFQNPPSEILKLLTEIEKGFDV